MNPDPLPEHCSACIVPGKALKALGHNCIILLNSDERERFDIGERPVKCNEECETCPCT